MQQQDEFAYSQDLFGDEVVELVETLRDNGDSILGILGYDPPVSPMVNGMVLATNPTPSRSSAIVQPNEVYDININDSDLEMSQGFLQNFTDSDTSLKLELDPNLKLMNPREQLALPAASTTTASPIAGNGARSIEMVVGTKVEIPDDESVTLEDWSGPFNFKVTPSLPESDKIAKKKAIYSDEHNKLFCDMGTAIPFKFEMDYDKIGHLNDLMIRAYLVYEDNDATNKAVLRCASHTEIEKKINDPSNRDRLAHMLRPFSGIINADMTYWQNTNTERCYILIPLKFPEAGTNAAIRSFCFTCRNSCNVSGVEGKSRRTISLMFCLFSTSGEVLGRSHTRVRVCSAPIRDYKKEIETGPSAANRKRKSEDVESGLPSPKQVNFGSGTGELPLTSNQDGISPSLLHRVQALRRSVVRAPAHGKSDDDGVSSSQETIYSCDESEHRIQLRDHIRDLRWVLKQKHSDNPAVRAYSNNVFNAIKLTQDLCNSARRLVEELRQESEEKSPDGGFHDVGQDI